MRWAVEYELPSGSVGLCIFSAEDPHAAQAFVDEMQTQYGHDLEPWRVYLLDVSCSLPDT